MRCRALYFGWQAVRVRRLSPLSSSTSTCGGRHDLLLHHEVAELALHRVDEDLVAGLELVDPVEGGAVGGAVAGDGRVALLPGQRGLGVVARALLEVGDAHALPPRSCRRRSSGSRCWPPARLPAGWWRCDRPPPGTWPAAPRRPGRTRHPAGVAPGASRMPVPHSWYTTNRSRTAPTVMQVRPIAPRVLARRIRGTLLRGPPVFGGAPGPIARGQGVVSSLGQPPWNPSSSSAGR